MFSFGKSAPELLLISLFLLTLTGKVTGDWRIPGAVKVTVMEEDDAILPCSLSTKENIEAKLFDWKKDGQNDKDKEVFLFNAGLHYNNQPSDGQDPQFRGRVFHFQDELQHGNASIIIRKSTCSDSGNYTCVFPKLHPKPQTFHIELVVDCVLKRRNTPGAAPEPCVTIIDQTKDWSLLQCAVRGAFPKPTVEWKDSSGNIVPADEPKVTERGGRFDVTLQTTVTKTDHYHCVATQKEIHHQIDSKTFVRFGGDQTGWIVAAVLGILLLLSVVGNVLFAKGIIKVDHIKCCWGQEKDSEKSPVYVHEQRNGLRTEPLLNGSDVPAQTSSV